MSCDIKTGVCEKSATHEEQGPSKCCHCGGHCGGDPMVCKMNMWECSFHQAMKGAQIDVLKEKIKKAWATKLDKEANAVLEVMEAKWKAMQAVGQAQCGLKEKFHEICKENK